MTKIGVIGAGSWGTALAALLTENGHHVTLWSYRESQIEEFRTTHKNESKLPGYIMPDQLNFSANLEEVVKSSDLLVFAVPSKATRATAEKVKAFAGPDQKIVSVTKGIEPGTLYTQCQIIKDVIPNAMVGVLSGPSHAEEVILHLPTVVVCGTEEEAYGLFLQDTFMNDNFRVYTSPDMIGIEIGGSCKNVIALAAGMSDGIGFGDNAKAALITRGVKEITDLALAMGGKRRTLDGLAGIGDLIVTCQSKHSRNRMAGYYMGQGYSKDQAMEKVNMIVEGVYSAEAALALGQKYDIPLPIIEQVNEVLFQGLDVKTAVLNLMTRDKKAEIK